MINSMKKGAISVEHAIISPMTKSVPNITRAKIITTKNKKDNKRKVSAGYAIIVVRKNIGLTIAVKEKGKKK